MTYTSQMGIEKYFDQFFDTPGFFLEIGCWDGIHISQTAWLEKERGWRGVCVDPFARNFENRSCLVANHAVGGKSGVRKFIKVTTDRRNGGDVSYLSGFKDSISVHWRVIRDFCNYEEVDILTISFSELARLYSIPSHIDFLSLDTEGSEVEILRGIDFSRYTFGMICVEHNQNEAVRKEVADILLSQGYELYEAILLDDLYVCSHKQWLENEYSKWIEALQQSSVLDFKGHPMVRRMLGEIDRDWAIDSYGLPDDVRLLEQIDNIGRAKYEPLSGIAIRMIYYARQILKAKPTSIVEIGGGSGQLFAILRALGYKGEYYIYDLLEVRTFQDAYLREVERQTDLRLNQELRHEFCVSLYALGEFDDETKAWYVENVIRKCRHGLVVWNPHSRASSEIPFPCEVADEVPSLRAGNKVLTW